MLSADATGPDSSLRKPHLVAVWDGGVASCPLPLKGAVVIGRSHDVDFHVAHSSVSRRHAVLYIQPMRDAFALRIEDLGSSNGTYVATRRLDARVPERLVGQEEVMLGAVSLLVRFGAVLAAARAAATPSDDWDEPTDGAMSELRREVDAYERERILLALQRCGGNQTLAAQALGISRRTLVRRLGEWGITRPRGH
jgi:DNA-binding NtrC family response regulator